VLWHDTRNILVAYLTSVEVISVVTLIRTDTTLDYSQEAESMAMAMAMLQITYEILYTSSPLSQMSTTSKLLHTYFILHSKSLQSEHF
ncbi:MAG: hypothetical protein VXY56_05170, partial [Pseudomonadota bacterium]|nr:hypothetical protein [Pseudomonadota bacterium]